MFEPDTDSRAEKEEMRFKEEEYKVAYKLMHQKDKVHILYTYFTYFAAFQNSKTATGTSEGRLWALGETTFGHLKIIEINISCNPVTGLIDLLVNVAIDNTLKRSFNLQGHCNKCF